jgi:diaminohydroxyphosphoribosylaminopyrimidine deaminase/5-amino-6-(5-phosphoribosylamino)uracil reductase
MVENSSWMRMALTQAAQGLGTTSPNPPVGAVIVSSDGRLLGIGYHEFAGGPHAEVQALRSVADVDRPLLCDATIYVTLEPCSTYGRTPPCCQAILDSGIRRVVWAMDDPNPAHQGNARTWLSQHGISVQTGLLQAEAEELLRPWSHYIRTGRPYVIAKTGMSVDGRITRPMGESQWLTSEASRANAMQLRLKSDAVLVGAGTVREDNPRLTIRGVDLPPHKKQPWRIVLGRRENLPPEAHLLTDQFKDRTKVMGGEDLPAVLQELAAMGIVQLVVEGGAKVLTEFFVAELVDEWQVYVAPLVSGSGKPAVDAAAYGASASCILRLHSCDRIGDDVKLIYRKAPKFAP